MEVNIFLKDKKEAEVFKGDRIDILDFEMGGVKYKQVRCFRNGFSKSELIESSIIDKVIKK
jgi:hypothetical protein